MRGISVILMALFALTGCGERTPNKATIEPMRVLVATPIEKEITDYEYFTGRAAAPDSVEIRARVNGYLDKPYFKEGDEVKKGDKLFEIDRRPYQADYDQQAADLERAKAAKATAGFELERERELFDRKAASKRDLDLATGRAGETEASVRAAEAALAKAKLNLDFTIITAPVDGRVSKFNITPGNLVVADQTLLTTLVSVDPVYVYADLDENTVLMFKKLISEGKIKSASQSELHVGMALANETGFPHDGIVNFVDNRIDPNTGTLRVRAVFKNSNRLISPGAFCRVRIPVGPPHPALLVSERAIGSDQGKKFVFIVNDKNLVDYRPVELGSLQNGLREVRKGLTKDDRLITVGLQRVRPGMTVDPQPGSMLGDPEKTPEKKK